MKLTQQQLALAVITALFTFAVGSNSAVGQTVVTAGANMNIDFNEEIDVPYNGFLGSYNLQVNLLHDPGAGPMIKRFQSPITDTNDRILLDAAQPFPQPVWEDFFLVPTLSPFPSEPVNDWHEEILTEGWEWVLPGDTRFPGLFPPGQSLITRNGEPHPWRFPVSIALHQPHKLWVEFPKIHVGETLDIHKALLWVGTDGNRIWGDDRLDDGSFFDESNIRVWEYPTIPEPSTYLLFVVGAIMTALLRSRI